MRRPGGRKGPARPGHEYYLGHAKRQTRNDARVHAGLGVKAVASTPPLVLLAVMLWLSACQFGNRAKIRARASDAQRIDPARPRRQRSLTAGNDAGKALRIAGAPDLGRRSPFGGPPRVNDSPDSASLPRRGRQAGADSRGPGSSTLLPVVTDGLATGLGPYCS